jgi:hypothetical protein
MKLNDARVSFSSNAFLANIRTTEPPPLETFIQLLLDAPTGEVRARAIVQRSKPKEGIGVKFIAMQQEHRARFVERFKHLSTNVCKL